MRHRVWFPNTDIVHMRVETPIIPAHYLCGLSIYTPLGLKEYEKPVNCPGCLEEIEEQKRRLRL